MQRMQSPVVGIPATFDVSAVFELVDIGHDAAGQQAELLAERLLASAGSRRDRAQDARVGRGQVDSGHLLGELCGRVMAELGQQKGHAVAAIAVRSCSHQLTISSMNGSVHE